MGTVSSQPRRRGNEVRAPERVRPEVRPALVIPSLFRAKPVTAAGLLSGLPGQKAAIGLADMPTEIVHHIVSFLSPAATLYLAGTSNATRHTIKEYMLSAALTLQTRRPTETVQISAELRRRERNIDEQELFFGLLQHTLGLPPYLRVQPLTGLGREAIELDDDWHIARIAMYAACKELPPALRAAPVIALARRAGCALSGNHDMWQEECRQFLDLVSDMAPQAQAAALSTWAGVLKARSSLTALIPIPSTMAFDGILDAAQKLPVELRSAIFESLARSVGQHHPSLRDQCASALSSASEALGPLEHARIQSILENKTTPSSSEDDGLRLMRRLRMG